MPLVIFEGPEAAGKTTLIDALEERWGSNFQFRGWGPRESWLEYCQPLFEDIKACRADPKLLIIWSRSWLSRAVYNSLLAQGQSVPNTVLKELDHIVVREGGLLLLIVSPINVLLTRRLERLSQPDSKPDHPLDPEKELSEFYMQNKSKKWKTLSGIQDPQSNVDLILNLIVSRNPESRMDFSLEEAIAN
jgi:thymidylate kinase